MIIVEKERGTPAWRAAHAKHITPSDSDALLARENTKLHRALVERLVLDFEGIGDHRVDNPEPWTEAHEDALIAALAIYRKEHRRAKLVTVGFIESVKNSWLGASPHALIDDDGVLLLRPHRTLRGFHTFRDSVRDRARAQLLMLATRRAWCDVVDIWDGRGSVPDKVKVKRVAFDHEWLLERVFPRIRSVWHEVEATLATRSLRDHRVTKAVATNVQQVSDDSLIKK